MTTNKTHFAAHSDNFSILKATRQMLIALGIPDDKDWNDGWEEIPTGDYRACIDHIVVRTHDAKLNMQYHSHNGSAGSSVTATYELPGQLNEFIDAVVKANVKKPEIKIAGYEAKFGTDTIAFGCQTYTRDEVAAINKFLDLNSTAKLSIANQNIDTALLNEILVNMTSSNANNTKCWSVGDTLTLEVLNRPESELCYPDSTVGWYLDNKPTRSMWIGSDRKIEAVEIRGGKLAAKISNSYLWISIDSLQLNYNTHIIKTNT